MGGAAIGAGQDIAAQKIADPNAPIDYRRAGLQAGLGGLFSGENTELGNMLYDTGGRVGQGIGAGTAQAAQHVAHNLREPYFPPAADPFFNASIPRSAQWLATRDRLRVAAQAAVEARQAQDAASAASAAAAEQRARVAKQAGQPWRVLLGLDENGDPLPEREGETEGGGNTSAGEAAGGDHLGLPGTPGSYGEGIRLRMKAVSDAGANEVAAVRAKYDRAEILYEALYKRFEKNKASADEVAKANAALNQVGAERAAVENSAKGRMYAAIAAPDPMGEIAVRGKLGDGRDAILSSARNFVRSIVSQKVAPSLPEVRLSEAVKMLNRRFSADYDFANQTVRLRPQDKMDTAVHEMGHWLEYESPAIRQRAFDFYDQRTQGEAPVPLGGTHDPHEMTRRDHFLDWYAGKEYSQGGKRVATELMSMGVQWLYEDPQKLAKEDPHFFDFLISTLHGK